MQVSKITMLRTSIDEWSLILTGVNNSVFPFKLNKLDAERLTRQCLRSFNPVGHELQGVADEEMIQQVGEFAHD